MEKITVLTKLDFRTLKYCNLFVMKYKRKSGLWFLITSMISLGVVAYALFFMEEPSVAFAILGGVFILYSGYQYFNLEKRLDTQLMRFFDNRRITEQRIEVSQEHLLIYHANNAEPVEYDWAMITEIYEMPEYYMLMAGKSSPVILDRSKDALLEGEKSALDEIIKEKASTKPFKKVDHNIVKRPITYVHPVFEDIQAEPEENTLEELELVEPEFVDEQVEEDSKDQQEE